VCQWNDGWGWQVRSGARVGGHSSRGRSECREGAAYQDDNGGRLGPITGLPNAMQVVNWCCPSLEGRRVDQMSWEFSGPTRLLRVSSGSMREGECREAGVCIVGFFSSRADAGSCARGGVLRNRGCGIRRVFRHLFVDLYRSSFLASYHPGARSATTSTAFHLEDPRMV
jgi:hypothetical protein